MGLLISAIIAIVLGIIIFIKPAVLAYIVAALMVIGGIISLISYFGLVSIGLPWNF